MRLAIAVIILGLATLPPITRCLADSPCADCQRDHVTCQLVPNPKPIKKIVYECRDVPYCVHRLPGIGKCDCCPECIACPRYKRVLIKREVICGETCDTKCVPVKAGRCGGCELAPCVPGDHQAGQVPSAGDYYADPDRPIAGPTVTSAPSSSRQRHP